jgi:hypothetical protein
MSPTYPSPDEWTIWDQIDFDIHDFKTKAVQYRLNKNWIQAGRMDRLAEYAEGLKKEYFLKK